MWSQTGSNRRPSDPPRRVPPTRPTGGADAARDMPAANAGEYGELLGVGLFGDRRHSLVAECTASTPRSYKSKPSPVP